VIGSNTFATDGTLPYSTCSTHTYTRFSVTNSYAVLFLTQSLFEFEVFPCFLGSDEIMVEF